MKTPGFLFSLDPETAHHLAMAGLQLLSRSGMAVRMLRPSPDPMLRRTVFGVDFPNPIGLAAGFDKNAIALPAWEALGFGFVEAGTITARAQPGNPKPRIFRLRDRRALINRMGFNNDGADAVATRLKELKRFGRWPSIPIGINLGKTKLTPLEDAAEDYVYSFRQLADFADYVVLNVSSPNTPGLRKLQDRASLDQLLSAVQQENRSRLKPVPLLVKIAPDLDFPQIEEVLELASSHSLAGMVATNTTLDKSSIPGDRREEGGLSGAPLQKRSTDIVRFICSRSSLPVIAAGGIEDVRSAREKLDVGAALIQLYTGFVYRGPALVRDLRRGLSPDAPPHHAHRA